MKTFQILKQLSSLTFEVNINVSVVFSVFQNSIDV